MGWSSEVLSNSKDEGSSASLGHLFHCSITCPVKKFSYMFKWNLLYFSLCPLPLVLSLGTTEKSLSLSSLPLPHQVFTHIEITCPESSLVYGEQSQLTQPLRICQMFQYFSHLHGPLLDPVQHVHVSLALGSPELEPELQMGVTRTERRGRIISIYPLVMLYLVQSRRLWTFFAARVNCWPLVNLSCSTNSLQSCFLTD